MRIYCQPDELIEQGSIMVSQMSRSSTDWTRSYSEPDEPVDVQVLRRVKSLSTRADGQGATEHDLDPNEAERDSRARLAHFCS